MLFPSVHALLSWYTLTAPDRVGRRGAALVQLLPALRRLSRDAFRLGGGRVATSVVVRHEAPVDRAAINLLLLFRHDGELPFSALLAEVRAPRGRAVRNLDLDGPRDLGG